MRTLVPLTLCAAFVFANVAKAQESREQRFRIEMLFSGERQFSTFIAETPMGGETNLASRFWTGGLDVCAAGVVAPWVHLGGCLGAHIATGTVPTDGAQWFADATPSFMARAALRATFLAPRYLRGGVDLAYRSYISTGRESAVEAVFRVGIEARIGLNDMPVLLELSFRAPLVSTVSDSTYAWPILDDFGELEGYDNRPTRDVRIFAFGLTVGTFWGR